MKSILAFLLIGASFAHADTLLPAFDLAKINANIAKILGPIFENDSVISNVSLVFDPAKMDLQNNKYAMSASATAKSSGWSKKPTTVTTQVALEKKLTKVAFEGELKLQGEILPMINYIAEMIATTGTCQPTNASPREAQISEIQCSTLVKLQSVVDLKGLEKAIQSFRSQMLATYNQQEKDIQGEYAAAPARSLRQEAAQLELEKLQEDRKMVNYVTVTAKLNEAKELTAIEMSVPPSEEKGSLSLLEFSVVFAMDLASTKVRMAIDDISDDTTMGFKTLAANYLVSLQNGDPEEINAVVALGKSYTTMVKALLNMKQP